MEGLSLHEEEEGGFNFEFEEEGEELLDFQWCLVGRFICDRPVHANSMKVRRADLWRPVKGVTIKEAKPDIFLFHFSHPLDMEGVLNGGPWTFDSHLLVVDKVQLGMQIEHIPLFHADFWVQIHNLPVGLMKEKVGITLANYIGTFVEYDKNNNTSFWRQYMRVRVKLDVRQPLKKDTRVKNKVGEWCTVNFKYEKLGVFCFVCGIMGHAENKCDVRFSMETDDGTRGWSGEIRAEVKRQGGRLVSQWLKEERGGGVAGRGRAMADQEREASDRASGDPTRADVATNRQNIPLELTNPNHNTIITRQQSSLVNYDQPPHHDVTDGPHQIIQSLPIHTMQTHLTSQVTSPMTTNKDQLSPNQNLPSIHLPIANHHYVNPLLPNHNFIFNSNQNQPSPIQKRNISLPTNGPHTTITLNQTGLLSHVNPEINRTAPEPTQPISILNRVEPVTHMCGVNQGSVEDMETQLEKKRRREEEGKSSSVNSELSRHFLAAGPGSQDCRDQ